MDFARGDKRRARDVSAAQRLRHRDYVRVEIPVLECEPLACAAEARLDFVHYKKRTVLSAKLLRLREKFGGRNVHAVSFDRLGDERGDVALLQFIFKVFEIVEIILIEKFR